MTHSRLYKWGAALAIALGLLVPALPAHAQPTVSFVIETAPPPRIEEYPSVVYDGRPVYYVNDRWYYRQGPDWVYYRDPPESLRRHHHWRESRPVEYRGREPRAVEYRGREPRAAEYRTREPARGHERHVERREVRHEDRRDRGHRGTYVAPRAR